MVSRVRLRQMIRKEFRVMLRDRRIATMIVVAPLLQLLVFGFAVTTEVRDVRTVVLDRDRTSASRAVTDALTGSGYFRVLGYVERPADLIRSLDDGSALVALDIPCGFAERLAGGRPAPVQVLVDGTNANTANIARGYVELIVRHVGNAWLARATGRRPEAAVGFQPRVWYNPALESRIWYVPGTAGVIILNLCLMLTALAIVREREEGTLEQLLVSPVKPIEIMVGKTAPVVAVTMLDVALVTTLATTVFGVPLRGSLVAFGLASLLFVVAGLAAGLLLSTVSQTQQEASMSMALIMAPMNMLSGFIFPISSMPKAVQWLTLLNPLRYEIDVLRGVFLKGVGLGTLWPQFVTLAAMAGALLFVAARRFQRRLG